MAPGSLATANLHLPIVMLDAWVARSKLLSDKAELAGVPLSVAKVISAAGMWKADAP